jgi:hypothetical protein
MALVGIIGGFASNFSGTGCGVVLFDLNFIGNLRINIVLDFP